MNIFGITIVNKDNIPEKEAEQYVLRGKDLYGDKLKAVTLEVDKEEPEYIGVTYSTRSQPFERIRRITGYLVGGMDRWNNAKRAEEADRVKHEVRT